MRERESDIKREREREVYSGKDLEGEVILNSSTYQ
jgi:hypothetical protein